MSEDCTDCNPQNYACDSCREQLYKELFPDNRPADRPEWQRRHWKHRTADEIVTGDALVWYSMTKEQLRAEHELLRRTLQDARAQIKLWAPIVAWRHRCPKCKEGRLSCPSCGDPW